MAGISDASTSRELEEKPSPRGDPAPLPRGPVPARERKATPARGSSTPVETLFAPARGSSITNETLFSPAWGASTTVEIFFAHAHSKWLIFDYFHRAGAIFLSQRHPERPPGATQGRSFFHAAPSGPQREPAALPGRGARGWRGLAGQRGDAPNHTPAHQAPLAWRAPEGPEGLAAVPAGGGAWPDNEATHRTTRQHTRPHWRGGRRRDRRAWLRCPWAAAGPGRASRSTTPSRQARVWRSRGRAAAHGHTKQPGPPTHHTAPGTPAEPQATTHGADSSRAAGPTGAQNTSGATRHLGTTKPPSPTGAGRLRQSAREGQRRITTMSGSPRPLS